MVGAKFSKCPDRSPASSCREEASRNPLTGKKGYLTNSGNGGDNFSQLQLVENGGFTGGILQITTHQKSASRIPATALASLSKTLHKSCQQASCARKPTKRSGAAKKGTRLLTAETKQVGKDKTYQANHQDTHLLLAKEAGEQFRY